MERERRNQPLIVMGRRVVTARHDAGSEEMDGPDASQIWLVGGAAIQRVKRLETIMIFLEASIPRLMPRIS